MDLIYTDKDRTDVGVLKNYNLDLAYGEDENDFELAVATNNNVCNEDYFVYFEGTDYGGIIDTVEIDTKSNSIKYKGRSFHGILDSKIISPDSGADYLTVTGDINTVLSQLLTRLGLDTLFVADTGTTKNITYKFPRYVSAYGGITKMLHDNGYKLHMQFIDGYIHIKAVPVVVYTDDTGLDSDRINFKIKKTYNRVNHLICLGTGELRFRTVVHLYLDRDGNISGSQVFTGLEEITSVFDYSNAESADDLIAKGKEFLLKQDTNSIDVTLGEKYEFDVGDIITVTDVITKINVTRRVVKKIVNVNRDYLSINYQVGE